MRNFSIAHSAICKDTFPKKYDSNFSQNNAGRRFENKKNDAYFEVLLDKTRYQLDITIAF